MQGSQNIKRDGEGQLERKLPHGGSCRKFLNCNTAHSTTGSAMQTQPAPRPAERKRTGGAARRPGLSCCAPGRCGRNRRGVSREQVFPCPKWQGEREKLMQGQNYKKGSGTLRPSVGSRLSPFQGRAIRSSSLRSFYSGAAVWAKQRLQALADCGSFQRASDPYRYVGIQEKHPLRGF